MTVFGALNGLATMTKLVLLSCILGFVVLLLVLAIFILVYLMRIGRYIEKGATPHPGEQEAAQDENGAATPLDR